MTETEEFSRRISDYKLFGMRGNFRLKGKTVTVRLTAEQARCYEDWIQNRRKLKKILIRMQAVSIQAAQTQTTTMLRH